MNLTIYSCLYLLRPHPFSSQNNKFGIYPGHNIDSLDYPTSKSLINILLEDMPHIQQHYSHDDRYQRNHRGSSRYDRPYGSVMQSEYDENRFFENHDYHENRRGYSNRHSYDGNMFSNNSSRHESYNNSNDMAVSSSRKFKIIVI